MLRTSSLDMQFFSLLASRGSLTSAARELRVSTAAVSKRLAALEQRLGVTLLNRTTRRLQLTPEGEAYLAQGRRILHDIEAVEGQLAGASAEPTGLLRIQSTLGFGRLHLAPAIATFVRRHPKIQVQLQLSAAVPALSEDAWDVCVRFGDPPAARVAAWRLAPNRRLFCAAPAYLKSHGAPKHPRDLADHACIVIRQQDEVQGLLRLRSARATESVRLRPAFATNDGEVAVHWALSGLGIVLRAEWDVGRHLQSGRLVQVLPGWETPPADLYAISPDRLAATPRVARFVDHLRAVFAS